MGEKDIFKKVVLAGMGLVDLTVEKAEVIAKDLVKRGELAQEESKKYTDELLAKAKEAKTNLESKIDEVLKGKQYATKEEVQKLEAKIDELLKKLNKEEEGE